MPEDPRLNPEPAGGTDSLLQGLNTLSTDDLDKIKEELDTTHKESDTDQKTSPRTVQYLRLLKRLFGTTYEIFGGQEKGLSRDALYNIYDEMDESTAYITSALDIMSDDATQPDDAGQLLYVDAANDKVRTVIENLFEDLEIESKLSKWARAVAKYGDLFIRVYGSTEEGNKGVSSIDDTIYPSRVQRKDFRGKLVAFIDNDSAFSEEYQPPWTYVHFRHKGDLSPERNKTSVGQDEVSLSSSYGQSVLRAAIKVYTQLRFVENMILLSRLTNSVRRNVFAINVGDTEPAAAFETIKQYADLLKKDINFKMDEEVYNSSKHTSTYDEDIFIPVSDPKNDFTVTSVGGDANISEQYDLEYLLNKLFAALKIPKAYLNYEQDLNARATLIQLDIRYARSVSQLQTTLVSGLTRLAKIHLAYLGMDPDMIDFEIYLTGVSAIDQESRLEQKSQRVAAARDFWDVVVSVNDTLRDAQEEVPEGGTNPSGGSGFTPSSSDSGGTSSLADQIDDLRQELPDESPEDNIEILPDEGEEPQESVRKSGKRLVESVLRRYNSPLDLEYLASKLFGEYLDLPDDEVNVILRKSESDSLQERNTKRKRSTVKRIADNLEMGYPTDHGKKLYESTILTLRKDLEDLQKQEDEESSEN